MPAGGRPRVVIDTNVFVSGLNFPGRPREVLDLMVKGEIEVMISPFIVRELEDVLKQDFGWEEKELKEAIRRIRAKAVEVNPKIEVHIIKEKDDDNRILECALEGRAQYIISGDKRHILPLKEFKGIKILSPAEFLRFLSAGE